MASQGGPATRKAKPISSARLAEFRRIGSVVGRGTRNVFRVMRANPLTLVGFVMVLLIVITAVLVVILPPISMLIVGKPWSIAPYDPSEPTCEASAAPSVTNTPLSFNATFASSNGSWMRPENGMSVDGVGMYSTGAREAEVLSNFTLSICRDTVTNVGVNVWLSQNATGPGQHLGIWVSTNAGKTWIPAGDIRAEGSLVHIEWTNLGSWSASSLDKNHLQVLVVHLADPGTSGNLTVDYLGVTATFMAYWHLMGTDSIGRDIFSRVLVALPLDLAIGFAIAGFALLAGGGLGLVAGFWDKPRTILGSLSVLIMRLTDVFLAFPSLVLALAIAASLGRGTGPAILAVMLTWWPFYVRLTRGEVLAVKHLPYVTAARSSGVSDVHIMVRHVLRNVIEPLVVYFTMDVGTVIVTFSTISFIGIGVPPSTPEWGSMVEGYEKFLLTLPWTVLWPGAAIFVTVLAFSLLGDGLRDILDPRSRRVLTRAAGIAIAPAGAVGEP